MGAMKAGVRIVTVSEKDNVEALDAALAASNAKGILIEPESKIDTKGTTRLDMVN